MRGCDNCQPGTALRCETVAPKRFSLIHLVASDGKHSAEFLVRLATPADLPVPSRQSRFEPNEPRSKPCEVEFLDLAGAAIEDTLATVEQTPSNRRIPGRARNVAQGAHESAADRSVRDRIVTNLFESQIEQAVEIDPRNDYAEHVRRIVKMAPRRITARPPD